MTKHALLKKIMEYVGVSDGFITSPMILGWLDEYVHSVVKNEYKSFSDYIESKETKCLEIQMNFDKESERTGNFDMSCCPDCGSNANSKSLAAEAWTSVRWCWVCKRLYILHKQDRMGGVYEDLLEVYKEKNDHSDELGNLSKEQSLEAVNGEHTDGFRIGPTSIDDSNDHIFIAYAFEDIGNYTERFAKLMQHFSNIDFLNLGNGCTLFFDDQAAFHTGMRVLRGRVIANGTPNQMICEDYVFKTYIVKSTCRSERWRIFDKNEFVGNYGDTYLFIAMDAPVPEEFKDLIEGNGNTQVPK